MSTFAGKSREDSRIGEKISECRRCGRKPPASKGNRPRVWCSEECQGALPATDDGVAIMEVVLSLLSDRARAGAVGAMVALLRYWESVRDIEAAGENPFAELDAIDHPAARRNARLNGDAA